MVTYLSLGSKMSQEERNQIWYPTADLDDFRNEARTLCRKLRGPQEEPASPQASEAPERRGSLSPPPVVPGDAPSEAVAAVPGFGCASRITDPETRCRTEKVADCIVNTMAGKGCSESKIQECASRLVNGDEECEIDLTNTRGLEHRVCLTRQRNKHLAIRCTLKAQMRSKCPDFIARISGKCTQWAKDLARAEANRDYCEVYCPDLVQSIPKTVNICPFPMSAFKKRSSAHCSGNSESPCSSNVAESPCQQSRPDANSERCVRQKTCDAPCPEN